MLNGKNFCRSHNTGLESIVQRQQNTHQCHNGLTGPHISLQQPVHLGAAAKVLANLLYYPFLSIGKIKRKMVLIKITEVASHCFKRESFYLLFPDKVLHQQLQLNVEQLLKLQPELRLCQQLLTLRKMCIEKGFSFR